MKDATDEEVMQAAALEALAMQAAECEFPLILSGLAAVALISCLQVGLRHPNNTGTPAKVAREVIDGLKAMLWDAGYPACVELVDRGFNPAHDAPQGASK